MLKNAFLNLAPGTYEAIIAAFVILGLIQSLALHRKFKQCEQLKSSLKEVATAAVKAIGEALRGGFQSYVKEKSRADAAERTVNELQADIDDLRDNAARSPHVINLGDSHFAEFEPGRPARNHPGDLRELFDLLDGKGRNGAALDDLLFGGRSTPNVQVVHGEDLLRDDDGRGINRDDLLAAISGDPSDLERKLGGQVVGIQMMGPDGQSIEGAEKDALLRSLLGAHGRPAFDPVRAGTSLHEAIERDLADRGAHGTVAGMGGEQPDESCDTQRPHRYAASSPRAG